MASITGTNSGSVLGNSITANFTGINRINGGAGNDTFTLDVSGIIDTLAGNSGSDTLSSANGSLWNITGSNAGNIAGVLSSFTGMNILTDANSGTNSFAFADNINFNGTINGNAADVLDYSAYTSGHAISASITGVKSGSVLANSISTAFTGINVLNGGADNDTFAIGASGSIGTLAGNAGSDLLSSANGSVWNITGSNSGNITGVLGSFTGMETVTDTNSGTNNFVFADNSNFNGTLNGNGTDTLDYSAYLSSHVISANITGANSGTVLANSITANFTGMNILQGGAGNDTFAIGASGTMNTIVGNAGADTLSSANGSVWNITGSNAGNITGVLSSFTGMETLTDTNTGTNSFVFSDNINFSGNINGNATDALDYSAYAAGHTISASITGLNSGSVLGNSITANFTGINLISGGADNDTFTIGASGMINTLAGNGGSDTLNSANGSLWNITASNAGNISGVLSNFTGMEVLTDSNSGVNSFVLPDNINFDGTIHGNASDILDYSTYASGHAIAVSITGAMSGSLLANSITTVFTGMNGVTGGAGNDTFTLGASGSINALAGNAGTDVLSSANGNVWNITGSNAGNITGVLSSFTGMETLTDTNSGTNSFVLPDNINFNGTINGNAADVLDYSAYASGHAISASITGVKSGSVLANSITTNFTGINVINGGAGNDTFTIGASGTIGSLVGNAGLDILSSANGSVWNIIGSNAGNITSVLGSFTGMETLTDANTGANSFVFLDNINFNGTLNGNGSDTLDYSNYLSAHAITANITGANSGTVVANSITANFTGMSIVRGGAGNDLFTIGASGTIGTLVGNAGIDTLTALQGSTWNITGSNAGAIAGVLSSFTGMDTLTDANTGTNSFVFADNVNFNGTINGNATDTLDYSAYGSAHAIAASITGANSGSVIANSVTTTFTGINHINGGAGDDTFAIGTSGTISTLVGNSGSDTLSSANGSTWNLTGSNTGNITGVLSSFTGMETLTDTNSGTNSFVLPDNINFNGTINGNAADILNYSAYASGHVIAASITGAKSGSVLANSLTTNFTGINIINGGAGNDTFTIGTSGTIGTLAGNAGTDTLTSANGSIWNITGSNAGNITSVLSSFTGMETLTDSNSGTNSFVFPDNINFNGTINGNAADTLDYSSYASGHSIFCQHHRRETRQHRRQQHHHELHWNRYHPWWCGR